MSSAVVSLKGDNICKTEVWHMNRYSMNVHSLLIILLLLLIKYTDGASFIKMRGIPMLNYTAKKMRNHYLTANLNKNYLNGIVWLSCFIPGPSH